MVQVNIFWVVMPCNVVVGWYQHFRGMCCLHLHPGNSILLLWVTVISHLLVMNIVCVDLDLYKHLTWKTHPWQLVTECQVPLLFTWRCDRINVQRKYSHKTTKPLAQTFRIFQYLISFQRFTILVLCYTLPIV